MPSVSVHPDSFCLSAKASDRVFLDKLVSKSSDTEDEPADFSEQCRHSVTAGVWLCVFSRKGQFPKCILTYFFPLFSVLFLKFAVL